MKSATEVDQLTTQLMTQVNSGQMSLSEAIWRTGCACVGWPYTFGARGGKTTKNGIEVRTFDCRGFTYWCALQFGIRIMGAGCTTQWNDDSNWLVKGSIDMIPEDVLVCLFYREKDAPNKMAHTGFGFRGATVECSSGVQYFEKRKAKWQYWAIPKGITEKVPEPDPNYRPTIRRGDKGQYVTLAQTLLLNRGYPLPKYGADGSFGAETEAAVRAFQGDHPPLTVDGICGPRTWEALESAVDPDVYTVHIPGRPLYEAEAIVSQYAGAWMTREGSGT